MRSRLHREVSAGLARLSDEQLSALLASASPLGSGIGGRSAELTVGETPVFVKRIPLTDRESRPTTANVFGLPTFYQYGLGSTGFGAWRELAAHTMTTKWVLDGSFAGFPLMYHWRVLPDTPPEGFADDFGGIAGTVAHWDGSPAVRTRLEAIGRSTASLALFLEYVPQTLSRLFAASGPQLWVEDALARATAFMSSRGFVHFDGHFGNILTDGQQLFFADFGLASSTTFELSAAESAFLSDHLSYDHCYTMSHLLRGLLGGGRAHLDEWLAGHRTDPGIVSGIDSVIGRHARSTVVLDDFHRALMAGKWRTRFPADALRNSWR
ncbi:MAG: hypothetical protein ABW215_23860 [Kibdelosporangium sp.]